MTSLGIRIVAVRQRIMRAARAFRKDTKGTVSVEFALWMPVFMLFILFTADVSLAFTRQSNHQDISHDAARILSRHGMSTAEAILYVKNKARFSGYTPKVEVQVTDSDVTVSIIANANKMAPFGTLSFALGETVVARVKHTLEPI